MWWESGINPRDLDYLLVTPQLQFMSKLVYATTSFILNLSLWFMTEVLTLGNHIVTRIVVMGFFFPMPS